MAYVYLIGNTDKNGIYKIGVTKANDVNKRLKQLQTSNSSELFIKESYKTNYPFKLEKMLHSYFNSQNVLGEWFELSENEVEKFNDVCKKKEQIILSLKDNPFFFKTNKQQTFS